MPVKIDFLKNHPHFTELCAQWGLTTWGHFNQNASHEGYIQSYTRHQQDESLPLTIIAFIHDQPVGMASLRENDGLKPTLKPWLGSLYVAPEHRLQGIGAKLITAIEVQAKKLEFDVLHLLAFDPTLPRWYARLGWIHLGQDTYNNHPVTVMHKPLF